MMNNKFCYFNIYLIPILALLLINSSCSKQTSGSPLNTNKNVPKEDFESLTSSYIIIAPNEEAEYNSQHIRISEVVGDTFFYTVGIMNNYQLDKQGNKREGTHPETEFRMQAATFRIVNSGTQIKLEFISSSCKDRTKNPFEGILPVSEITMTKLEDKLILKISETEEDVLFKTDTSLISSLYESNVSRILCGDETNE